MFRIALAGRNFGTRPSDLIQIEHEVTALDFDLACSHRLEVLDGKNKIDEIIALSKAVAVMLGFADPSIFETSNSEGDDDTFDDEKMLEKLAKIRSEKAAQNPPQIAPEI